MVTKVLDGQAHPVVVDIEAASQLGFPRAGGRVAEHLSAAVALLVKRGRTLRDGDKGSLRSATTLGR